MATVQTTIDGRRTKVTLAAGETSAWVRVAPEVVVTCNPGSGGSMLVEATWSNEDDINAGNAIAFPWDAGTVTAKTLQTLQRASAVRFTATNAAGVGEVAR
jgi:hypothetical protein